MNFFSACFVFLPFVTFASNGAVHAAPLKSKASIRILKSARRLEENGQDQYQEEEEYAFLSNYKLKLLSCKSGETYINPENGEYEYSTVVFRLCPAEAECSNDSSMGCSSGYGDYVVGLNTFAQNYLRDKREEMQGDDDANAFNIEEYGECREYEVDQDGDDDGNQYQYFVGPACAEGGVDIKLQMYVDEGCQTVSDEVTFEDISNGMALPYSSGGLISNGCESCSGYNDNGEYELSEMCMQLYQNSGKCESNMESFHYTGKQEGSCEFVESLLPQHSSTAGKAVGWTILFLLLVGAGVGTYIFFKKKNDEKSFGLMNS